MQRGEVTREGSRHELGPLAASEVEMLKQREPRPSPCQQEPVDSPTGQPE